MLLANHHLQDNYDDIPAGVCRVGDHPHDDPGPLCAHHLQAARDHLAALPGLVQRLAHHLTPGPSLPGGGKVTTSRVGSPTPARLDVLTLIGPGGAEVRTDRRALVPLVRRWSTMETVTVAVPRADRIDVERRQVRVWHREVVTDHTDRGRRCRCGTVHTPDQEGHAHTRRRPVLVPDTDQVGLVPPAEWLDVWVRQWRRLLGHPVPARGRVGGWVRRWRHPGDTKAGTRPAAAPTALPATASRAAEDQATRLADAAARAALLMPHRRAVLPAVAAYLTIRAEYANHLHHTRNRVGAALVGLDDGPAAAVRADTTLGSHPRRPDTVAAEWELRYGVATTAARVAVDAGYLAQWLLVVADHDGADVGAFAVELRALVAELEHTLGEIRAEEWVGRCPVELVDGDGQPSGRLCGHGIWHDPYRARIECPRCHTAWDPRHWVTLAAKIRAVWPIDPRRLYTVGDCIAAERHTERLPTCPGCERTMAVRWREVRGREPRFRPAGWLCPAGCIAGGIQAAA